TRRRLLDDLTAPASELLARRTDGRVKLFATRVALRARRDMRELFEDGEYVPLATSGAHRECVFAFARQHGGRAAITCVPRLVASLVPDSSGPPLGPSVWHDTRIDVPAANAGARAYQDVFTGSTLVPADGTLPAA